MAIEIISWNNISTYYNPSPYNIGGMDKAQFRCPNHNSLCVPRLAGSGIEDMADAPIDLCDVVLGQHQHLFGKTRLVEGDYLRKVDLRCFSQSGNRLLKQNVERNPCKFHVGGDDGTDCRFYGTAVDRVILNNENWTAFTGFRSVGVIGQVCPPNFALDHYQSSLSTISA